jgi:hypothetical protein
MAMTTLVTYPNLEFTLSGFGESTHLDARTFRSFTLSCLPVIVGFRGFIISKLSTQAPGPLHSSG